MAWQRYDTEQGTWVTIPDEFGGGENDRYVDDHAPLSNYSGAGQWSNNFKQANDFGNTAFYGTPGSVGKMLADAAKRAGVPDYDFNQSAAKAAPGYGWQLPGANGWLLGANEEQIYRNILQNADNPALQALANERSQESYNTGAKAGVQRDADLAARNAADDGGMGDLMKIAALAATVYSGGSLAGLWGTGAGVGAGAGSLAGEISGSLGWGGADALSSLGGQGLMDFMNADAASSAGLSSGGGMDFDSLFGEMFGPMTETDAIINTAGGGGMGPLESLNEFFGPMSDGGASGGYTIDMSGHAIDAAGNVVNGTDGGLMDFMKGAIQSGNIDQLMKVLPSIPGGSTALKTLFGGGSGSAGLSSLFGGGAGGGKYSADIGGILNSILGYTTNKDYQKSLIDVMNRSIDAADPFKSQRPFYQQQLQSMFTDPNYFNNNALLKGANDMAVNDTTRKLASQGYNMSGNVPMEVGQRLQQNNMSYAQKLMDFTGQAAGASINPSSAGTVAATTGTTAANAGNAGNASLGNLFNTVWNGNQPSLADQYLGGANKNPNLGSVLFS